MQQNKIHILHTRRQESAAVNNSAPHLVFDTVPFIRIVLTEEEAVIGRIEMLAGQAAIVVFTSTNAIRSIVRFTGSIENWKIYCIGGATRTLAEKHFGTGSIAGTAEDARALAHVIAHNDEVQQLVFFCGSKRRDELPVILSRHDIDVEELVVYETLSTPQKIDKTYDGISFFSASAAESFFSVNTVPSHTLLFAIGQTTADAIKRYTGNQVLVCNEPSAAAMQQLIIDSFRQTTNPAG